MKKETQLNESDAIILNMIMQHCHVEEGKTIWIIDNGCLSANEKATRYLKERGILKNKRRERIYSMSKRIKF